MLYYINIVMAITLLFSYILPYISPKTIPIFGVFSLAVPFLIICNACFFIFWIFKIKKYFWVSAITLLIGWLISTPFYRISSKKIIVDKDIKILSYNVRMFNIYKQIKTDSISKKIISLIHKKNPDIVCFQEYHHSEKRKFSYPYSYFVPKSKKQNFGLAIYSNYKIINKGSLDFKNSANNTIFIDIVKKTDTIRIYNVHLQSLKINPNKQHFGQKSSEILVERLKKGFLKQVQQTEKLLAHEKQFTGKKIICGDFNNTAYSWVYKQLAKNKKDSFLEAGNGFGKSFQYFFPMRIDFILTDKNAKINYFTTHNVKYSDHYPIMSHISW